MRILILGASSYIGARIYYDLNLKYQLLGTYHSTYLSDKFIKLNLLNEAEIKDFFANNKVDLLVHVANNANPRWCAANPILAKQLNVDSTKFLLAEVNNRDLPIIYISSFSASTPDASVYCQTKAASEDLVKSARQWLIIRPSLTLGMSPNKINDRPFNRMLKNIDQKVAGEYDTSWKFQATYVKQISQIIDLVISKNIWNIIIPSAIPELKSRYEIAKDLLSYFNLNPVAIDLKDPTPVAKLDLSILDDLGLSKYTYQELILNLVNEIKQGSKYFV